jgi:hypothetical protein
MIGKTKPKEKETKPAPLSAARTEPDAPESYTGHQSKKGSKPHAMIPTVFGTPEQVAAMKKFVDDNTTVEINGKIMTLKEFRERKGKGIIK